MAVQWLDLCPFTAKDPGSVPGWGAKIPQAVQPNKFKKLKNIKGPQKGLLFGGWNSSSDIYSPAAHASMRSDIPCSWWWGYKIPRSPSRGTQSSSCRPPPVSPPISPCWWNAERGFCLASGSSPTSLAVALVSGRCQDCLNINQKIMGSFSISLTYYLLMFIKIQGCKFKLCLIMVKYNILIYMIEMEEEYHFSTEMEIINTTKISEIGIWQGGSKYSSEIIVTYFIK